MLLKSAGWNATASHTCRIFSGLFTARTKPAASKFARRSTKSDPPGTAAAIAASEVEERKDPRFMKTPFRSEEYAVKEIDPTHSTDPKVRRATFVGATA